MLLDEWKNVSKYPKLCGTVEPILLAFSSLYMVESEFNHVRYFQSKQEAHWTLNVAIWSSKLQICNLIVVISSVPTKPIFFIKKIIQELKVHLHL